MILLPHAKRIAHDSGRGMGLPGLYSGRFLFCKQHEYLARHIHSQVNRLNPFEIRAGLKRPLHHGQQGHGGVLIPLRSGLA